MNAFTFRDIPSVDRLLAEAAARGLAYPREALTEALRRAADRVRLLLKDGNPPDDLADWIFQEATDQLQGDFSPSLQGVVNATGVVLHTNLGRALLPEAALQAVLETGRRYSNLEMDLNTGHRGHRIDHVEGLLQRLTGCEAAAVVNNNAAAVLLILDELARGREVVVSRGELIEIGGSFRLPEVLKKSGATLVEVGTTNKTYLRDYEDAITPTTGLLLKSHPSNFRIVGFTHQVERSELAALGERSGIATAEDLGSGLLVDLRPLGIADEPTVQEVVESGMGLVCFPGDKLLGGPQAGIIVGKRSLVDRCRKNPMMRAVRVDKLTLAALEATLRIYLDPERLWEAVPTLAMLKIPLHELQARAHALAARLAIRVLGKANVEVEAGDSEVGGGTLAVRPLPTALVSLQPLDGGEARWEETLRRHRPPVVCRVTRGKLLLDVRTLRRGDEDIIESAVTVAVST